MRRTDENAADIEERGFDAVAISPNDDAEMAKAINRAVDKGIK